MKKFYIPTKEEVKEHDRKIFYALEQSMGFVPNIYAFMAHSDTALKSYLTFSGTPTVFCPQEAEIIHLVVSQIDKCQYCLSAHTALAKKAGLTDEQIIGIRKTAVPFNEKWDVLAKFTCEMMNRKGNVRPETMDRFFGVGYTDAHLVDLVMLIAGTVATNFINNVTHNPIDFPEAPVVVWECDCGKE